VSAPRLNWVGLVGVAVCGALFAALTPAGASAFSTSPSWTVTSVTDPTVFTAGDQSGTAYIRVIIQNTGDAAAGGPTVTDTLPAGLSLAGPVVGGNTFSAELPPELFKCVGTSCTFSGEVPASYSLMLKIPVDVASHAKSGEANVVSVAGGGAPEASRATPIEASPTPSFPGYGIAPGSFSVALSNDQAGGHADMTTTYFLNTDPNGFAEGNLKDTVVDLPPGFAGDATEIPYCTAAQLLAHKFYVQENECPVDTQIGSITVTVNFAPFSTTERDRETARYTESVYNMRPQGGEVARLGFKIFGSVQNVVVKVRPSDYGLEAVSPNLNGFLETEGVQLTTWGLPALASHDPMRDTTCIIDELNNQYSFCVNDQNGHDYEGNELPPPGLPDNTLLEPYLSNPTACTSSPMTASIWVDSYQNRELPSEPDQVFDINPMAGCDEPEFNPGLSLQPTTQSAENPTGLNVSLTLPQTYSEPAALATSALKNTVVTLPEGMTINPSAGAGLAGCSEAQFHSEELNTPPGKGCPSESSMGTVTIQTPVLEEPATGSMFLAKPYQNQFGSLLALYVVARIPDRGVIVKVAGKITPNPVTGQLVTTFENTPQLPFSRFTLAFRPGEAAPLVSPPVCGSFSGLAQFTSWSEPEEVLPDASPAFPITEGVGGGACPSGGVPPFNPKIISGTISNAAGTYSPFYLRIIRRDGEQEITKFSTTLPPGLSGNLSGIPFCSEEDIEAAKHVSGQQELEHPSCPAASEIGHTQVGAGVGPLLAQTPGKLYLAGSYHGSGLSIVSITSAVVGPFDLGTVVIRFALTINQTTAQVEVNGAESDPIPHIIDGIVVHVRDIRVYVDRPDFILNPTNCDPMSISAAVQSTGLSPANPIGAATVTATSQFQTADCSSLKYEPSFKVSTMAHTSRADGASLTAKLSYPEAPLGHQANITKVKVELPKQLPSRLTTLQKACTAATFDADPANCPPASIVGYAKALTPILPVPMVGPAFFVSNGGRKFPELIVVLQGYAGVTIVLHGETFISKAGITSSTFATVPDVPIGSFELYLPAGPDSALAGNGKLCTEKLQMPTEFVAQNGTVIRQDTPIAVSGCKAKISVVRHSSTGKRATVVVKVPSAGKLLASAEGLAKTTTMAGKAGTVTVKLTLSVKERAFLVRHQGRKLAAQVALRFTSDDGERLSSSVMVLLG
jgi:uncharacterized repeat protein (TIGR01451 family)